MDNKISSFDKWMPLIGVLIGGIIGLVSSLLAPYITSRVEKKKHKRKVKIDLLQNVYELYNYYKGFVLAYNQQAIDFVNSNAVWEELRHMTDGKNPVKRSELERQHAKFQADIDAGDKRQHDLFEKLLKIESTLMTLTLEVETHYGAKKSNSVENLLEPVFEEINKPNLLHAYPKLDAAAFEAARISFPEDIQTKTQELQRRAVRTTRKLRIILS
jgi:gas vesicle protein